jgi:tripartite-type tricarboxylate transporter receptor subunit TctC
MIVRRALVAFAATFATALGWPALAAYPDHPVRIIVPYAAGGPADVTARLVAAKLQERIGQSFIVDNRSGAGGNIGTAAGAQAAPDGYTFTVITPAQIINTTLFAKPGYELGEFAPVALFNTAPALLLANPKLGVSSVAELIAAAKAKPGAISFASQGTGVAPHLMMEMIKKAAGIDMVHVPYRGSAPALNDLIAGNVPLMMDSIVTGLPHVKSGALKALAVSTAKRTPLAPDIPTVAESGIPGFEASLWYGIVAPARTPPEVVQKIASEIAAVLKLPDIRERLIALGSEPADTTPESFAAFIKAEAAKWGPIVISSGAKAD